jgi:PPK2 family polyphosphate:nucleotide phosphotransferase
MAKNHRVTGDVPLSALLRAPQGAVDVAQIPTDAAPGYPGKGKADADALREGMASELGDLQERMFADGRAKPETARSVLVILQGMDCSGKGGVIRHAVGLVDPQGLHIHAFKAPTPEERQHDFLWRITNALPTPGMIGIFDRSQYEDVLIARVDSLVTPDVWGARYELINDWEADLVAKGVTIIKCFLHESKDEQKARLLARLEGPDKYWKYSPNDLPTRAKWDLYQEAYSAAIEECNTDVSPWHVIPADKKWYRDWAVAELMREKLSDMNLSWPAPNFDVAAELAKVKAS